MLARFFCSLERSPVPTGLGDSRPTWRLAAGRCDPLSLGTICRWLVLLCVRAPHRPFAFYGLTASKSTHSWKARADALDDRSPPHVLHRPRASGIRVGAPIVTVAMRQPVASGCPRGETVGYGQLNICRFMGYVRNLFRGEGTELRSPLRPRDLTSNVSHAGSQFLLVQGASQDHPSGSLLHRRGFQCSPSDGQSGGRIRLGRM